MYQVLHTEWVNLMMLAWGTRDACEDDRMDGVDDVSFAHTSSPYAMLITVSHSHSDGGVTQWLHQLGLHAEHFECGTCRLML